jgi:DNA polymerase sigma
MHCSYRLVKAWAVAHGLNDAAANTLNSWSLGLLVAFYLQVSVARYD